MTEILVNASAPDRATALATMAALGIAEMTPEWIEPVPGYWVWTVTDADGTHMMSGLELPDGADGEWVEPNDVVHPSQPVPLVSVTIAEVPHTGTRSLWNFWYHGASAEVLMKEAPEGGWLPEHDLFERTHLLEMIDQRTGIAMEWAAFVGVDGEPPGYETPSGVRLYDPSLISSPNLVKQ